MSNAFDAVALFFIVFSWLLILGLCFVIYEIHGIIVTRRSMATIKFPYRKPSDNYLARQNLIEDDV
tara:strand:+ start:216 stop:413 length:198 start_codon:yes stop_codon:yes gene_type:complete